MDQALLLLFIVIIVLLAAGVIVSMLILSLAHAKNSSQMVARLTDLIASDNNEEYRLSLQQDPILNKPKPIEKKVVDEYISTDQMGEDDWSRVAENENKES